MATIPARAKSLNYFVKPVFAMAPSWLLSRSFSRADYKVLWWLMTRIDDQRMYRGSMKRARQELGMKRTGLRNSLDRLVTQGIAMIYRHPGGSVEAIRVLVPRPTRQWAKLPAFILADNRLKHTDYRYLWWLIDKSDRTGWSFWSEQATARSLDVSVRTVRRFMKRFTKLGYLETGDYQGGGRKGTQLLLEKQRVRVMSTLEMAQTEAAPLGPPPSDRRGSALCPPLSLYEPDPKEKDPGNQRTHVDRSTLEQLKTWANEEGLGEIIEDALEPFGQSQLEIIGAIKLAEKFMKRGDERRCRKALAAFSAQIAEAYREGKQQFIPTKPTSIFKRLMTYLPPQVKRHPEAYLMDIFKAWKPTEADKWDYHSALSFAMNRDYAALKTELIKAGKL